MSCSGGASPSLPILLRPVRMVGSKYERRPLSTTYAASAGTLPTLMSLTGISIPRRPRMSPVKISSIILSRLDGSSSSMPRDETVP
jgi:hypothetical protein